MSTRAFVAASVASLTLTFGVGAAAQEACGDTTCPKGWTCETDQAPCPDVACADGSDCPVCEPTTTSVCRPGPCTSDSDCDSAMRCVTQERRVCSGGAPPCAKPDGSEPGCPEPEPEECVLETVSACLPKYVGPCETAADCGDGFTCEPEEECSCGGSAGGSDGARPDPADGGAGDPLPPEDCGCRPSGTNHCVLVKVACTEATAGDVCPSGWTCEENPEGVCFSGPDGSGCTPADPPELCLPPFQDLGGGRGEVDDGGSETSGGAKPPASGAPGRGSSADGDEPMSSESGGCSVSGATRASSGALLGLALAAVGLTLARRRR